MQNYFRKNCAFTRPTLIIARKIFNVNIFYAKVWITQNIFCKSFLRIFNLEFLILDNKKFLNIFQKFFIYVVAWVAEAISKTNVYVSANRHPRRNTCSLYDNKLPPTIEEVCLPSPPLNKGRATRSEGWGTKSHHCWRLFADIHLYEQSLKLLSPHSPAQYSI